MPDAAITREAIVRPRRLADIESRIRINGREAVQ
jgi:hypothetical protein